MHRRLTQTFIHTDGDIAAVLHTLLLSREFSATLGAKFKDPMRFVVSAIRFAYDGRPISNSRPVLNWLNGLGEGLVTRRVVMRARDVVFFKGIVEASEGLAAVFAEHGGDLVVATPEGRAGELDAFLDELCVELGALRPTA